MKWLSVSYLHSYPFHSLSSLVSNCTMVSECTTHSGNSFYIFIVRCVKKFPITLSRILGLIILSCFFVWYVLPSFERCPSYSVHHIFEWWFQQPWSGLLLFACMPGLVNSIPSIFVHTFHCFMTCSNIPLLHYSPSWTGNKYNLCLAWPNLTWPHPHCCITGHYEQGKNIIWQDWSEP